MRIAITSQGTDLNSEVDPRFGRGKWFIVYDTETDGFEAKSNDQNINLPQGAGIQAAQNVAETGAEALLTGHCGPKAFDTLSAAGIKVVVGVSGLVKDAVEKFKTGEIKATDSPDVEGHW